MTTFTGIQEEATILLTLDPTAGWTPSKTIRVRHNNVDDIFTLVNFGVSCGTVLEQSKTTTPFAGKPLLVLPCTIAISVGTSGIAEPLVTPFSVSFLDLQGKLVRQSLS
jgi:hypothetical protein